MRLVDAFDIMLDLACDGLNYWQDHCASDEELNEGDQAIDTVWRWWLNEKDNYEGEKESVEGQT